MAATVGGNAAEGAIAGLAGEAIVGADGEVLEGPAAGVMGDAGGWAPDEPVVRAGVWGFGGTRGGTTWRAGGAGTTSSSSKGSWLMAL